MVGEVTREHLDETSFFGASEVNYGNLDELRDFASENKLWYQYECGAGGEWDAQTVTYNPNTEEEMEFIGEQDMAIPLSKIKELGSYEAILAYFAAGDSKAIPPLEITDIDWDRPVQWSTGEEITFAPYDSPSNGHRDVSASAEWTKVTGDNYVAVNPDGTILGCEGDGYPTVVNVPEGGAS
jgi:hypothetical protein